MDEFGAELDGHGRVAVAMREYSASDPLASLEQYDVEPLFDELACGSEPGNAGSDDEDLGLGG